MRRLRQVLRDREGQSTVQMVFAIPVMIILATIAFNTLTFLGNCAVFDRVFRDAVRVYGGTVSSGQEAGKQAAVAAAAQSQVDESCTVEVSSWQLSSGLREYRGVLTFSPTLFGRPLRGQVFGVALPAATHTCTLVVDPFKAG